MRERRNQFLISIAVILFGFTAVFGLSSYLEKNQLKVPESYSDEDLSLQGKRLKGYALGFEGLLADWYWMRALQYIGDKVLNSKEEVINIDNLQPLNPRLLYPLLDNATDLDPKFVNAYSFGAILLPAIDARQAIMLAEKGIANNPDQWRLYQYLGYIYWRMKDYTKAAEIYEKGAAIPGSGSFMEIMAARMKTEGGSRDTARQMYEQMLAEAVDEQTKVTAQNRLMQLDSLDERDAMNSAMRSAQERRGHCPSSWHDLLPLLDDVKLPHDKDFRVDSSGSIVDPSGTPYLFDERTCTVKLDAEKTKIATDE